MNSHLVPSSSLVMMIFRCLMAPLPERSALLLILHNPLLYPPYLFLLRLLRRAFPPLLVLCHLHLSHPGARICLQHLQDFNPTIYPHCHPPLNFLPRQQNPSSIQDPLSSAPHQTFQAHRASQLFPPPLSQPTPVAIPGGPSLPSKPTAAAQMAAATVEGAPELRDLKREATAFVPTAVKRKKLQPTTSNTLVGAPDDE
jgi:hypothetical protein